THLNSANYLHEHIPSLIEHAALSFEYEYGTSSFENLLVIAYARTICTWKVLAQDGGETYVFSGFITKGPATSVKAEDLVTVKLDVQISSGKIVQTTGSSASGE